jgi:hypothetical protein
MQIILSILLYLNVISSPGTYFVSQINDDVAHNSTQISSIQANPKLLNTIIANYQTILPDITILDDGQLKFDDEK